MKEKRDRWRGTKICRRLPADSHPPAKALRRQTSRFLKTLLVFMSAVFCAGAYLMFPHYAYAASGYASVGGSWMIGSQSYFSVDILGGYTRGFCLNHGAAAPFPGYYPYTADVKTYGAGGSANIWVEGSTGTATYDEAADTCRSQTVTFRSGTSNASWSFTVPAHCQLHTNNTSYEAGRTLTIFPDQSFYLTTTDPAGASDEQGKTYGGGDATADASTTKIYSNIVITPPDAWDGYSYANGLPAGYQRVGTNDVAVNHYDRKNQWLGFSTQWLACVRYFVDGETTPCATHNVTIGSLYTPTPQAHQAGAKPQCTPGLDAWYRDRLYRNPYQETRITGNLDLFGHNVVTLSYASASTSPIQAGIPLYQQTDTSTTPLYLSDILAQATMLDWGTTARLQDPRYTLLYLPEEKRWRTLRHADGWYLSPSAVGNPVHTLRLEHDTTVYDNWTQSTYDGVLDW